MAIGRTSRIVIGRKSRHSLLPLLRFVLSSPGTVLITPIEPVFSGNTNLRESALIFVLLVTINVPARASFIFLLAIFLSASFCLLPAPVPDVKRFPCQPFGRTIPWPNRQRVSIRIRTASRPKMTRWTAKNPNTWEPVAGFVCSITAVSAGCRAHRGRTWLFGTERISSARSFALRWVISASRARRKWNRAEIASLLAPRSALRPLLTAHHTHRADQAGLPWEHESSRIGTNLCLSSDN